MDFDKNFPGVQTIMMNQNYRSTPQILNVANSLIEKNQNRIKKNLIAAQQKDLLKPFYFHAKSAEEEAEYILEKIKKLTE